MIGIYVTREVALRHLKAMREELLKAIRLEAVKGLDAATYNIWVDRNEERLEVLEFLEKHLSTLPVGTDAKPIGKRVASK